MNLEKIPKKYNVNNIMTIIVFHSHSTTNPERM